MTKKEILRMDGITPYTKEEREEIQKMLENFYDKMYEFYKDVLYQAKDSNYVVFIGQRSFILARIFYQILLEDALKDEDCEILYNGRKNYCTDTMFLSYAKELSIQEHFNILLVDELITDADILNNFLLSLEKIIKFDNEKSFSENQSMLIRKIKIRAFARNPTMLLFYPAYQERKKVAYLFDIKDSHRYSVYVNIMIKNLPIVHNSFLQGIVITEDLVERLDNNVEGFFQVNTYDLGIEEKVFFYTKFQEIFGCSLSIRAVYRRTTKNWQLIPFIFLPEVSQEKFEDIASVMLEKWLGKNLVPSIFESGCGTRFEAINMLLATSLLEIFMNKYFEIGLSEYFKENVIDVFAIKINYGFSHQLLEKDFENSIEKMFDSTSLCNEEELIQCLKQFYYDNNNMFVTQCIQHKELVEFTHSTELSKKIEKAVYLKTMAEQEFYFKKQQGCYLVVNTDETQRIFGLQKWLCNELAEEHYDVIECVCCLFRLLDKRALVLNFKNYEGQCIQTARTGEEAEVIFPKKHQDFISIILSYQRQNGKDDNALNRFLNEVEDGLKDDKFFKDSEGLAEELFEFIKLLEKVNQTLDYWNFSKKRYS